MASIVEEQIFHYRDAGQFLVHRYVLMPNHLHIVLTPGESTSLEKAVQLIKGGSSHEIGRLRGMRFPVWHQGFTEHQIREQRDFELNAYYIDKNPVKARLAVTPGEYVLGSASGRFAFDSWPMASGAKAPESQPLLAAGLKPRPPEAETHDFSRRSG